jgi:uncharacterized protein (DUF952 family)
VIFCLLNREQWGDLNGDLVAAPGEDGFVHCCDERQLEYVRRRWFPTDADVVAVGFDPTLLRAETRYEPGSAGESERFPHVYGELRLESVALTRDL